MSADRQVVAALTALLASRLVTDRHALNCAWADLTAHPRPEPRNPWRNHARPAR